MLILLKPEPLPSASNSTYPNPSFLVHQYQIPNPYHYSLQPGPLPETKTTILLTPNSKSYSFHSQTLPYRTSSSNSKSHDEKCNIFT